MKYKDKIRIYNSVLLGLVAGFLNTRLGYTPSNFGFWAVLLVIIIVGNFIQYLIEKNED